MSHDSHMTQSCTNIGEVPLVAIHVVLVHLSHTILLIEEDVPWPHPVVVILKVMHLHLDLRPSLLQTPGLR